MKTHLFYQVVKIIHYVPQLDADFVIVVDTAI